MRDAHLGEASSAELEQYAPDSSSSKQLNYYQIERGRVIACRLHSLGKVLPFNRSAITFSLINGNADTLFFFFFFFFFFF